MAAPTPSHLPPNFDPWIQNFTFYDGDGNLLTASMSDLDYFRQYGIREALNFGTQIGASVVLLLFLVILTKREKRLAGIFIMNALCLIVNIFRTTLFACWLTSNYWNPYSELANDSSHDTWHDRANTVATNTMTLLLTALVMISLSMQVWVVCITTPALQRVVIMGLTTVLALIAVGYRFAVTVISNALAMKSDSMVPGSHLVTMANIFQAIAIWTYCVIFTLKLGYALIQRRRLGMTQFGPMQIIFIMGAQTMVFPAIFTSLQFYNAVPQLGSQALTIVCIFLPLSAIWAGVVASEADLGAKGADSHQRLLRGQFGRSPVGSAVSSRTDGHKGSTTLSTFDGDGGKATSTSGSSDKHGLSIQVERDWSVEKGEASGTYDRHNHFP